MRFQSTKNGEKKIRFYKRLIVEMIGKRKSKERKHRIGAQDMCTKSAPKSHFNASEIAKLKARVQQLGYNVKTK